MRNQSRDAGPRGEERLAAADYIAAMSDDLSALARRHDLVTLAYLLDMARLEAETAARGGGREGLLRLPSEKKVDAP